MNPLAPDDDDLVRLVQQGPVTVEDVANELGISWSEAQARLYRMLGRGRVRHLRKGRVNIFMLDETPRRHRYHPPPGVRIRPLDEVIKELAGTWSKMSSQEMVERERGHY